MHERPKNVPGNLSKRFQQRRWIEYELGADKKKIFLNKMAASYSTLLSYRIELRWCLEGSRFAEEKLL